jgi:diguanylate cyclase (GGDEF)-like protein
LLFVHCNDRRLSIAKETLDAVLDSLDTHIAVIDDAGVIHYVNQAWKDFANNNGAEQDINWLGYNYLSICIYAANNGDQDAANVVGGLHSVINQQSEQFLHEYPCHSPTENRWYLLRAVPLKHHSGWFVISHHNVTKNKLVEQQAEKLSLEDPLTGLYNRRGLDVFAKEEFSRAIRSQTSIGIIIIDVDFFKYYNDRYGHLAGDRCLLSVAKVIRHYARRPGDIAARLGGDEFILILSQSSKEQAFSIAESIRQDVYDLAIEYSNDARITISAGVTALIPEKDTSYTDKLYERADIALYISKKKRNCVFVDDVFDNI